MARVSLHRDRDLLIRSIGVFAGRSLGTILFATAFLSGVAWSDGIGINSDGITFADGTIQTTACCREYEGAFTFRGSVQANTPSQTSSADLLDVPAGHVALIDFVSARCWTPPDNPLTHIQLEYKGNADYTVTNEMTIPLFAHAVTSSYVHASGALQSRLYVYDRSDSWDDLIVYLQREGTLGFSGCDVNVSGRLLPLPAP